MDILFSTKPLCIVSILWHLFGGDPHIDDVKTGTWTKGFHHFEFRKIKLGHPPVVLKFPKSEVQTEEPFSSDLRVRVSSLIGTLRNVNITYSYNDVEGGVELEFADKGVIFLKIYILAEPV